MPVDFGTEYPLGEFLERNRLIYRFKNGTYGILESGEISMNLSTEHFKLNTLPTKSVGPSVVIKPMSLGDLFNYDDVEFKDPNGTDQQLSSFVQEMKGYIQKYGRAIYRSY